MNEGKILQMGPPEKVYSNPPNLFVAEFVGEMNFVKGTVSGVDTVKSSLGERTFKFDKPYPIGENVTLAIRPQHIEVKPLSGKTSENFKGVISTKTYLGDSVLFEVQLSEIRVIVKASGDTLITEGQDVEIVLPSHNWHIFK